MDPRSRKGVKEKQKIVVVSLHKTGTTTVTHFLEKCGFKVTGPDTHLFWPARNDDFREIDAFLERFDAFQDDPWYMLYPYIFKKYPNTKFVFLERPAESWLKSVQRFYGKDRYNNKVRNAFYGHADSIAHPQEYLHKYKEHNEAVAHFFKGHPNFLSIQVTKPKDAIKLQEFLELPVKFQQFDHLNKTPNSVKEAKQRKRKLWIKSGFGLNRWVKNRLISWVGYTRFLKIRDRIRWYRSSWRVFIKKLRHR